MNQTWQFLEVTYCLQWQSPWHVGSGMSSIGVDRLVRVRVAAVKNPFSGQRILRRVPYVPGSQIKGVLRHQCEKLYAIWSPEVASPHSSGADPPVSLLQGFRPLNQSPMLVDRLFGNCYQGECLIVEDAVPEEWEDNYSTIYGRTAIDRMTGTVREATLFFTEVTSQTFPQFRGRILGKHPPGSLTQDDDGFPMEYSLLLAALVSIDALGADKSVGLGRCQISVEKIVWNNNQQLSLDEALKPLQDPEWAEWLKTIRENA
jgi:CRISPR/Cas system CSM-associated protein Csm3 (group 7 of RAMP superfamily)